MRSLAEPRSTNALPSPLQTHSHRPLQTHSHRRYKRTPIAATNALPSPPQAADTNASHRRQDRTHTLASSPARAAAARASQPRRKPERFPKTEGALIRLALHLPVLKGTPSRDFRVRSAGGQRPGRSWSERPGRSWSERPGRSWSERPGRSWSERPGRSWSERPGRSWSERPGRSWSERPGRSWSERPGRSWSERPRWSALGLVRAGRSARGSSRGAHSLHADPGRVGDYDNDVVPFFATKTLEKWGLSTAWVVDTSNE